MSGSGSVRAVVVLRSGCGRLAGAAGVRVWQITSWRRGPRGGRPPPEGASVAYAPYFRVARYSDTISPARMVTTETMWVHYRRYCWSLTAPSSRIAAIR